MSSSGSGSEHNQFLGYCDLWNGYFIGTSIAGFFVLFINMFLSYKRDKNPTKGSVDWGSPWSIGLFLMNIALWNLVPANVFFVIFKEGVPAMFPDAERMACLQVQSFPFFTAGMVWLVIQIVFFYSPDSIAESVRPALIDDDLGGPPPNGEKDKRRVLIVGATVGRGRLLYERIRLRMEWLQGRAKDGGENPPHFVAKSVAVVYPSHDSAKTIAFMRNNYDCFDADSTCYDILVGERLAHDNVFGLPLADNSVEKVVFNAFFRGGPAIGGWVASEKTKSERVSKLLDEVLRVLKPGGRIVFMDGIQNVLVFYADLRDKLGEENVKLDDQLDRKLAITCFMKQPMWQVTAKKPLNYVNQHTEASPRTRQARNEGPVNASMTEMRLLANKDPEQPDIDYTPVKESTIMAIMCPVQVIIFLGLCFMAAAIYIHLMVPTNIPIGERVGNIFANLATSYPGIAFMEREVVINTKSFKYPLDVFKFQIKSSIITIVVTTFFTALTSVPKLCLQIGLAQTSLNNTVKSIIGICVSLLLGYCIYKFGQRSNAKKMIKERGLDEKYIKYFW